MYEGMRAGIIKRPFGELKMEPGSGCDRQPRGPPRPIVTRDAQSANQTHIFNAGRIYFYHLHTCIAYDIFIVDSIVFNSKSNRRFDIPSFANFSLPVIIALFQEWRYPGMLGNLMTN